LLLSSHAWEAGLNRRVRSGDTLILLGDLCMLQPPCSRGGWGHTQFLQLLFLLFCHTFGRFGWPAGPGRLGPQSWPGPVEEDHPRTCLASAGQVRGNAGRLDNWQLRKRAEDGRAPGESRPGILGLASPVHTLWSHKGTQGQGCACERRPAASPLGPLKAMVLWRPLPALVFRCHGREAERRASTCCLAYYLFYELQVSLSI
jgi:hypothetical protein